MLSVLPNIERDLSIFILFALLTFFLFVLATVIVCSVAGIVLRVGAHYLNTKTYDRTASIGKFCQQCGYDLRASRRRCPECGTAIPAPLPTKESVIYRGYVSNTRRDHWQHEA